ncbi:hypothetical protein [Sediminibacillus massiliensis]|uniref:hypothetical protein n=1 Tax=Sediminibacillus massiliensis TaxID=1926277 RepID=UPI0009886349|nr:hypothetical protein [Sediminibacillus massiliensis]
MLKQVIKTWIPYVIGVFIVLISISIWQGEEFQWGHMVTLTIAGLIGSFIGSGLRKFSKK